MQVVSERYIRLKKERCIRLQEERPIATILSDNQLGILVIDMANLSGDLQKEQEMAKIDKACEEWGFF